MSGGTFDYIQYQINDAIEQIERRLNRNGKTIVQLWEEMSEDEKECAAEYERPWDLLHHPYWIDDEAQDKADAALGIKHTTCGSFDAYNKYMKLSKAKKEKWQEVKTQTMQQLMDEHNNALLSMNLSDETIAKIKEMIPTIKRAKIFLDRIDWLFAGDDCEDSFKKRTEEELKESGLN